MVSLSTFRLLQPFAATFIVGGFELTSTNEAVDQKLNPMPHG